MTKTMQFEAVKVSMSQTRDGIILRLAIHPNDVPQELVTSWVGSRYMVVMVELGDDDQPKVDPIELARQRRVQSAGMLCKNQMFWTFFAGVTGSQITSEEAAAQAMREYLGVNSRSELASNERAAMAFDALRKEFMEWRRFH